MKKLVYSLFIAVTTLFVSCEKNSGIESDSSDTALISFVASKPSIEEGTKTAWNDDLSAVTWTTGDKIKVACLRDGQYWQAKSVDATSSTVAKIYTSKPLEEDCSIANFMLYESSIFTWTASGSYEFYSVYPASLLSSSDFKNAPNVSVNLKSSQVMSSSTFDADADIMVGKSTAAITDVVTEFTEIPMVFKRMVALSKITFKNLKDAESDELVKSITITAQDGAKVTGPVTLNILDGTADSSSAVNSVTVKSSTGLPLDENGSISVWFSTLEFTATSLKVVVETDAASYTRTIDLSSNNKSFVRNKRNVLSINMANADKEDTASSQPTSVAFGTLGYASWGETSNFSGTSKDEVIQSKDNVQITYTRNGSSLYANTNAIRFYKSNTIKFDAPKNYVITSIVFGVDSGKTDVTTNGGTCTATTSELSWSGSATSVTFTRPSGASSYVTLSTVTVTLAAASGSSDENPDPVVTTDEVEEVTETSAILTASYTGATAVPSETRFEIGLSSSDLSRKIYYNDGGLGTPSGSFSVDATSLLAGTTYYFRAVIQVGSKEYASAVKTFSTQTGAVTTLPQGWLELPAATTGDNYYNGRFGTGTSRNYTYLYDKTTYTALWSAYPLAKSHTSGSATSSSWAFNPNIAENLQINVVSSSYGSNYGKSTYSRGHQVPAADRKDNNTRRAQLYYVTNQTPQLQNGFNGTIWSNLEGSIRDLTADTDTVYVVTGATFQKVGGNETITYFNAAKSGIEPATIPVPNYYWKVLLKVKRSGSTITSAKAVGFWLEHKAYSSNAFASYAVSVDTIEQYTGFDFFVNLPDNLELTAETNSSWSDFQNF